VQLERHHNHIAETDAIIEHIIIIEELLQSGAEQLRVE